MKTKTLEVTTNNKKYPIMIGRNILNNFQNIIQPYIKNKRLFVITDRTINKLYRTKIERLISKSKLDAEFIVIGTGEKQKNIKNIELICNFLLRKKVSRNDTIIAFGGGVVGDISGFVSSIILRGINYIQIPTTLLSQVDSSVGGKTGINSHYGKNLIGTFFQPSLVIVDTNLLKSLPKREMISGYAEILKYGLMFDPKFFNWLCKNGEKVLNHQEVSVIYAIHKSCKNKALIVSQDEKEHGRRALLNFGHTFGHAIEQINSFKLNLNHGEAVSIGMIMALKMSKSMKLISARKLDDILLHFKTLRLPISIPTGIKKKINLKKFLNAMKKDKKNKDKKINLILLKNIGNAFQTSNFNHKLLNEIITSSIS